MNTNERKTVSFPVKSIDRDAYDKFRLNGMGNVLEVDNKEREARQLGGLRIAAQQVKTLSNYQEFSHWLADFSPLLVLFRGIEEGDAAENAATLEVLSEGTIDIVEVVVEKVGKAPNNYTDMGYITPEGSSGELILGRVHPQKFWVEEHKYYIGYECGGVKEHYILTDFRLAAIGNLSFKV